ncbi:efflux RND transporter periplasmic adaptor subunit [Mesohalobacter halotolerans]|uniref:Efflux RND transporter periplasmic adaptor subunit n=1 Tax=Mesohalobacter halotolerans TaxID=1883405 RepID=A0A4V6AL99_9FLAO|nr:efflux RND transporter periplasmic adaptor subunit [Mesohalobacter halotolerans]TKS55715.1 efflux RND transporter periplasmic adaptor subunit [Mesohalobacter halotolerans]
MDQVVKPKNNWKKRISIAATIVLLSGLGWLVYAAAGSQSISINAKQVDIATVTKTTFEEGISITGSIIPNRQTYLDASESGSVEQIFAKSGDELQQGDTIVQLSNSNLRLEVLQRESQLLEQLNTQRQTKILLNQNDLSQKQQIEEVNYQLDIQKRRYERNKQLFKKGVIAAQDYEEISKRYTYLKKRKDILIKVYKTDSLARETQINQIDASENRLTQNLIAVQNILDKLCITAPVDGKLSDFSLSNGERVDEGQRIGIVYNINPPKIEAEIDELYINNIQTGLSGNVQNSGKNLKVKLIKKFPGVEEGNFRVQFAFEDLKDADFYNGQTLRIQLNLSEPKQALVIPKGRFYSNTGGQWIFVVDGKTAEKQSIEIGQQNNAYYEIKSGLTAGEQVIISNYDNFKDYDQLKLK